MWPEERVSGYLKTLTEKTRPWHPTAYVVLHPEPGVQVARWGTATIIIETLFPNRLGRPNKA